MVFGIGASLEQYAAFLVEQKDGKRPMEQPGAVDLQLRRRSNLDVVDIDEHDVFLFVFHADFVLRC